MYWVVQCTSKKYHREISISKLFSNQKTKSPESTRKESLVLELSFSGLAPNPRSWREKEKGKVFSVLLKKNLIQETIHLSPPAEVRPRPSFTNTCTPNEEIALYSVQCTVESIYITVHR